MTGVARKWESDGVAKRTAEVSSTQIAIIDGKSQKRSERGNSDPQTEPEITRAHATGGRGRGRREHWKDFRR